MSDTNIPDYLPTPHYPQFSLLKHVKRAPWVDIGLIVGSIALITIGSLAHFGVLHHIGSLSQTTIEGLAFGGAGTFLFAEIAQRIIRQFFSKKIEPIDFDLVEPEEYSYEVEDYSVEGKIPWEIHKHIPKVIEDSIKASRERGITLQEAVEEEINALPFNNGEIIVKFKDKEEVTIKKDIEATDYTYYIRYVDKEIKFFNIPKKIISRPDFIFNAPEIFKITNERVEDTMDEAFLKEGISGTVTFQIGNEKPVTVRYIEGNRIK